MIYLALTVQATGYPGRCNGHHGRPTAPGGPKVNMTSKRQKRRALGKRKAVLIPLDVAHDSGMISPTVPI